MSSRCHTVPRARGGESYRLVLSHTTVPRHKRYDTATWKRGETTHAQPHRIPSHHGIMRDNSSFLCDETTQDKTLHRIAARTTQLCETERHRTAHASHTHASHRCALSCRGMCAAVPCCHVMMRYGMNMIRYLVSCMRTRPYRTRPYHTTPDHTTCSYAHHTTPHARMRTTA